MKRTILYSVFCVLCSSVQGANEINAFSPGISTAYSVIREVDGDVWYVSGQVFEAWGTGGRTAADYDISLTDKTGGMFVGDFDTNVSAGYYHIATHYQTGGSPADADPMVWQEYGYWDGDEWLTGITQDVNDIAGGGASAASIADAVWDEAVADHTTETSFGGEVGGLDPNVTLILADTNEIQTDQKDGGRLDLIWDAIKYKTDLISLVDSTVKDSNDSNNFTIEDGTDVNDAYRFLGIQVEDADDNQSKEIRWISQYDENSTDPNIWVDDPFSFTPATGDVVHVMGTAYGGYLWDIWYRLQTSQAPTHIIDTTKTGGTPIGGGVTRYDEYGDDP